MFISDNINQQRYSVLMAVYAGDNAEYLGLAIDSMINQTLKPSDFVIVCDGPISCDLETALDFSLAKHGELINVVRRSENGGLGGALRTGLECCKYDTVVRMDSDDISRLDRCEVLLTRMEEDNLDLVGSAIEEFNQTPGDMAVVRRPPLTKERILQYSRMRNPFNHMSVAFKKKAVFAAGGYKPFPYLEDYYLWIRMLNSGCKCANVANVLVDVRVGSGMYERRSNTRYLKSQCDFFMELRSMGYITHGQLIKTMAARTATTIMPVGIVKSFYTRFLRG